MFMQKISFLLLLLFLQWPLYGQAQPQMPQLSSSFIENKGQIKDQHGQPRDDVDFYLQSAGLTLFVGNGQLQYQYIKRGQYAAIYAVGVSAAENQLRSAASTYRLEVHLEGANPEAKILKEMPLGARYNYYTGNAPNGITAVQSYGKITYKDIYPSIDWVLYTEEGKLKYDFVVHPGGEVSDIRMLYKGATEIQKMGDGSLVIHNPMGIVEEAAPYSYELNSKRKVNSEYILQGHEVRFQTGSYEGTLVIDPGVEWATYFGGDQQETSGAQNGSLVVDSQSNSFITASTSSISSIATTGAFQTEMADNMDFFVAKFDSMGNLIWGTYYGGSSSMLFTMDMLGAIDLDDFGNLYLAGMTTSITNMATPGSFQPDFDSEETGLGCNGFLAKFDTEDGIRNWGTYYGASSKYARFHTIKCDQEGNIYAAGSSDSSVSMTQQVVMNSAHQSVYGGGNSDGLLVKFDSSGNRIWATYYGGDGWEYITTLDTDEEGNIYIGGDVSGANQFNEDLFTEGAFDDNSTSPTTSGNLGFIGKFSSEGVRQWGTIIRGYVKAVALDKLDGLYVAGYCSNPTFVDTFIATTGAYLDNQPIGGTFGYLMKFDKEEGSRKWGTFYGTESPSMFTSISCDEAGNIYAAGASQPSLAPHVLITADSYQDEFAGGQDGLIVKFDSSGVRKWASLFGGPDADEIYTLRHHNSVLYAAGITRSAAGIATPGAHKAMLEDDQDAFLVRWLPVDIVITPEVPLYDTTCTGEVPLSVSVTNAGRVNKTDDLVIGYTYTGPSEGADFFTFSEGLAIGNTESYFLGAASLPFEGTYNFKVYLQYTQDDNDRHNDTIYFTLVTTTAEPVAAIEVNQVGTNYLFNNPDGLPSYDYYWDFGDGHTSTEVAPTHAYELTDTYEIMLVVTGYCGTDTAYLSLEAVGSGSGVAETAINQSVLLYPNPAAGELYIEAGEGIRLSGYEIVNALGQTITEGTCYGSKHKVDVSMLTTGAYYIRLVTDKGVAKKPFQVLR